MTTNRNKYKLKLVEEEKQRPITYKEIATFSSIRLSYIKLRNVEVAKFSI